MKVRINKDTYRHKIGDIIEVIESADEAYYILAEDKTKNERRIIFKDNCTVIPELSNSEQAEIIRKVKERILDFKDRELRVGLCEVVRVVTYCKYKLSDIPALMKYEPNAHCKTDRDFWFDPYDYTSRLEICDKALADLECDDIKAFADDVAEFIAKHPEAKEALRQVFPDKFEEDKSVDFSRDYEEASTAVFTKERYFNYSGFDSGTIQIKRGGNYDNKAFYLSNKFNWELREDNRGALVLIPTKK